MSSTRPLSAIEPLERRQLLTAAIALPPADAAGWENLSQTVSFAGGVWFTAGRTTPHLYRSDGTATGTTGTAATLPMLQSADFRSDPGPPVVAGGSMFLAVGSQLWMTDGTAAGTIKLADQFNGSDEIGAAYDGKFYFSVPNGSTSDLYVSDGSRAGTRNLTPTVGGTPQLLGVVAGRTYFVSGSVLSSTIDGASVTSIATVSGVTPLSVQAFRGTQKLLVVRDAYGKRKLWVTDDTAAGTRSTDVTLDVYGDVAVYGGRAFFFGSPGNGSTALYGTDGTVSGTSKIADSAVSLNYTYYPPVLESTVFAGRLYLAAHGATADKVVSIDSAGVAQTIDASAWSPLRQYGDRLYLGEMSAYVTASAPTAAVRTDGLGPATATADGHYFVVSLPDSTNTYRLYTWDSTLPYYGSVHGTVYNDLDGDATRDNEDVFLRQPVRVYLDYNGNGNYDAAEASAVTGSTGVYYIDQAVAGTWPMRVAASPDAGPSGSTPVAVVAGSQTAYTSTLASYKGRFIGTVYNDANANGTRDGGESGLSGLTVYIASSPTSARTADDPAAITDDSGRYLFANLTSLSGFVRIATGTVNYRETTPTGSASVTAGTVGVVTGPAVGLLPPGTVRLDDLIDLDADGVATAADPAASAVSLPVWADLNANGVQDAGEPAALLADEGFLSNLPAGPVTLRVTPPQGWRTSLPGDAFTVTVSPGGVVRSPQFLITPDTSTTAVLSGVLAEDVNFNNAVDPGEAGAPLVTLWDDADADATRDFNEAFALTRADGRYAFASLPTGPRTIRTAAGAFVTKDAVYSFAVSPGPGAVLNLPVYASTRSARVSGQVRLDANNNGQLDATDPPLKGVYVQPPSYNPSAGNPASSTDVDGRFSALVSGGPNSFYRPAVILLPGYAPVGTTPNVQLSVGATKDDFLLLVTGPTAALGSVRGTLFVDDNANGVRDAGEPPLAGVSVLGDYNNDGFVNTNEPVFKTAADGTYSFTGIPTATFKISLLTLASYETVTNASGSPRGRVVTLNGQDLTGIDLGIGRFATINGFVFRDYDRDGVKGIDDTPAVGIRVWADANRNAIFDAGDTQAVTDTRGAYTLLAAPGRTSIVYADLPTGSTPVTAASQSITTAAAGTFQVFNVAFYDNSALITGRGYYDRNANGTLDSNELTYANSPTIVGQVTLYNASGTTVLSTASLAWNDTTFRFGGLTAGTYRVVFTPAGGNEGRENAGGITLTVGPQQVLADQRFGWRQPRISYGGRVMQDFGQRELPDSADVALAGVRAFVDLDYDYLYDAGEPTALSNANGYFTIGGIEFDATTGNYPRELVIQNPRGMRQAYPYMTSRSFYMSSPDIGTILFSPPRDASAVGYVYKDLNTNGVRDADEPGIAYQQVGQNFGPAPFFDAVVTDYEGLYIYNDGRNGGTYTLRANLGGEWIATDPINGGTKTVTVPANTIKTGPNFGFVDFQIGGRLFVDADENGKLDGAETPTVGRRVWIDADRDGVYDADERSTLSDAAGYFAFAGTGGGTFRLAQDKPAGESGAARIDVVVRSGAATGGITFHGRAAARPATFVVDDGVAQRSRVRQIVVTIDATLTAAGISGNAFALTGAAAAGVSATVRSVSALPDGRTAITLGFSGMGVVASSLADGGYTLSVDGSRLTDTSGRKVDAAGSGATESSAAFAFYRLFGDIDASGAVTFNDYLQLQNAFGATAGAPGFLPGLDGNGDDQIDFNDFLMLQNNFGKSMAAPAIAPPPMPASTAALSGITFNDSNKNAKYDKGDTLAAGRIVWLDLDDDGAKDRNEPATTADAAGRYAFKNLPAGRYRVRAAIPNHAVASTPSRYVTLAGGQSTKDVSLGSRLK